MRLGVDNSVVSVAKTEKEDEDEENENDFYENDAEDGEGAVEEIVRDEAEHDSLS